jgi:hypothetical protein
LSCVVSVRNVYYPNTGALGTLYVDYLLEAAARDRKAEEVEATKIDELVSRTDQLNRLETVQTLTHQVSVRSFESGSRMSLMQLAAAANHPQDAMFTAQTPVESALASDSDSVASSVVGDSTWSQQHAAAFTAPTRSGLARHTIGGASLDRRSGGVGRLEEEKFAHLPPTSRSFSVGQMKTDSNKAQTWQQIAKTFKQDSPYTCDHACTPVWCVTCGDSRAHLLPYLFVCVLCSDVGFTPFVASAGEKDYVMSGNRLRELSLVHKSQRTIRIGEGREQPQSADR